MTKEKIIMNDVDMNRALVRIAHQIVEKNKGAQDIVLVGIINRGGVLAKRLAKIMSQQENLEVPVGTIDVSLYRDDLTKRGQYIEIRKPDMPFTVKDKVVVLIDDVIFAGRTVRAALDGLKDYGRATKIQLAALIDRGNRELPINPDYTGKKIPTAKAENVRVELLEVDGQDRVVLS